MKVLIGSDKAGFKLKEHLKDYLVSKGGLDLGPVSLDLVRRSRNPRGTGGWERPKCLDLAVVSLFCGVPGCEAPGSGEMFQFGP